MRTLDGLVGAHARRRWRRGRPDTAPAPDLLERDFTAAHPISGGWVTSPSSRPTTASSTWPASSTCATAPWSAGRCVNVPTTDLVIDALVMAIGRRQTRPRGRAPQRPRLGLYVAARSRTTSRTTASSRRSAAPATPTTTPRWKRSGRHSNENSPGSTSGNDGHHAPSCAPHCSTTSRRSTTAAPPSPPRPPDPGRGLRSGPSGMITKTPCPPERVNSNFRSHRRARVVHSERRDTARFMTNSS